MGIDIDSVIVFGIGLDYQEANDINGDGIDLWDDDKLKEKYPFLSFGYASPWYDSDVTDYIYYIGIGKIKTDYSVKDLTELMSNWKSSGYIECLEELGIEFREPELFSVAHVW
jgi:hypothetical protein